MNTEHLHLSVIVVIFVVKLTPIFVCSMIKIKKRLNRRLIEYSHMVLGTRSAAKFEKVPSTSAHLIEAKQI